jgi:CheY-like chemotaxis protein
MGGTVSVDSIEGEGTTFRFDMDMPVDAARTMRRVAEQYVGKRVLIVEAITPRRTILNEKATAWGFEAAACESAREGIAMLDHMDEIGTPIDIVLLGDRIAEGAGSLFLDALRGRGGTPPGVVILSTVDDMIEDDRAHDSVVLATVARPVRSSYLMKSMERAIDEAARRAQLSDHVAKLPVPAVEEALEPQAVDVVPMADTPEPMQEPAVSEKDGTGHEAPIEPGAHGVVDILVAEDNEINQFLMEQILRGTGYSYRLVADGKQAVEAWREDRPRLILMDVSMPEMSGEEATMAIRKAEGDSGPHVPIVAVTAHALRGDRDRCFEAGMDDYISKPVSSEGVIAMIDRWIDGTAEQEGQLGTG